MGSAARQRRLERLSVPITMFDAAGSRRFAVTGAGKALDFGLDPVQAIILGTITGVGGGTLRDVLIRRVPVVLNSELYAIPALVAAAVIVVCESLDVPTQPSAVGAAALCFAIRMTGVRYGLKAPARVGSTPPTPTRLNGGYRMVRRGRRGSRCGKDRRGGRRRCRRSARGPGGDGARCRADHRDVRLRRPARSCPRVPCDRHRGRVRRGRGGYGSRNSPTSSPRVLPRRGVLRAPRRVCRCCR